METIREFSSGTVAFGKMCNIIGTSITNDKVIPMRNVTLWLRRAGECVLNGIRRFMVGRYGHDRLNMALLILGVVLSFVQMIFPIPLLSFVLSLVSETLLIIALWRCFSRNTYKRYQENRKFLLLVDQIKDRSNRYFSCPRCRQTVRVPRGKGKISITCPKCREKFVKKT